MALSEVEKLRIEEEEKIRAEVREKIQQAKDQKLRKPLLIAALVMFAISIILWISLERMSNSFYP